MLEFRLSTATVTIVLSLALLAACDTPKANTQNASTHKTVDAAAQNDMAATESAATEGVVPAATDVSDLRAQTQITASGNEPFWSVVVDSSTLTYATPDRMPGISFEAERTETDDGLRFSGTLDGSELVLELRDVPCQDTMSGAMFDFTASITVGGQTMTGCARRTSDPVEPA